MAQSDIDRRWWKEAVVYQIYPRSFNDSDGDGVGDIPGIVAKLDYLDELGVDVVWLNPVYDSPNADNGYDIADYRAIMDEFGTMADWERLLDGLHDRDIRLVMDLVVNHTSDEHEWFRKSRAGDPDYEDFYWWRDGRDAAAVDWSATEEGPAGEAPPNAWRSYFGGSAWAYDDERGQWYLHLFDRKQPDLNWENPRVRAAVFEMMNWWFDKGIDGFRMDVINLISKPEGLPNDPDDPFGGAMTQPTNGPRVHEFLSEMNDRVLDRDHLTVGEMLGPEMPMEHARRYLDPDEDGLSMLFHFEHMLLDRGDELWERRDWELSELKAVFNRWDQGLKEEGWNSLYLNNHDQPRMVSRFGDEQYRRESATLLATLLHTLRGTPYVYQGEELGMTNYPFSSMDEYRDVDTLNPLREALDAGEIESYDAVAEAVRANSRDNARTPMQWDATEHAGFTDGEPWIGVNPNHEEINVAAARADDESVWQYYRELVDLRSEYDVVVYGDYEPLFPDDDTVWAYTRTLDTGEREERLVVALNFSAATVAVGLPADVTSEETTLILGNYDTDSDAATDAASEITTGDLHLQPWEARVYYEER